MQINFKKSDDPEFLTNNPNRRFPDLTRARNDLGYEPLVSIEDGVVDGLIMKNKRKYRYLKKFCNNITF